MTSGLFFISNSCSFGKIWQGSAVNLVLPNWIQASKQIYFETNVMIWYITSKSDYYTLFLVNWWKFWSWSLSHVCGHIWIFKFKVVDAYARGFFLWSGKAFFFSVQFRLDYRLRLKFSLLIWVSFHLFCPQCLFPFQ
jgi:hypothetical protein